jgi:hypothetical protein
MHVKVRSRQQRTQEPQGIYRYVGLVLWRGTRDVRNIEVTRAAPSGSIAGVNLGGLFQGVLNYPAREICRARGPGGDWIVAMFLAGVLRERQKRKLMLGAPVVTSPADARALGTPA